MWLRSPRHACKSATSPDGAVFSNRKPLLKAEKTVIAWMKVNHSAVSRVMSSRDELDCDFGPVVSWL